MIATTATGPARLEASYCTESRQPLASLVFVAPLLAAYEIGVLALGPETIRNGADAWMREILAWLGFGQYFLLPILTVAILLAWHHTTGRRWRLPTEVLPGMFAECVLLSVGLWLVLQLQGAVFPGGAAEAAQAGLAMSVSGPVDRLVAFFGAGVYEELLFRLMLLGPAIWLLRRLAMTPAASTVTAVVITSLLFSAAHYLSGEPFCWFIFFFRFLAGTFFALVFLYRGFGIAAGAHAGYDILVGVL